MNEPKRLVLELDCDTDVFHFSNNVQDALADANDELFSINETLSSLNDITPHCDKIDYSIAAASGLLCGLLDVFFVAQPGESFFGDISDKWFEEKTRAFAKKCGWNSQQNDSASSAIRFLEKKFKIPYDQRGAGDSASFIFDLTPENHHMKSLGHNPTIMGLFFSILDQFNNTSHFISDGELIALQNASDGFELRGNTVIAKLFCGFVNWFGHLVSDVSGSSGSKSRGMGIPSPILAWTNDIITIRRSLSIPAGKFEMAMNNIAVELYKQGFDARFQAVQMIPVVINDLAVRFLYSVRRMMKYFANISYSEFSFSQLWKTCEPFSTPTVKRLQTVAHGTFCLVDLGDAVVNGIAKGAGSINVAELCVRINYAGVGRFTISLFGEIKLYTQISNLQDEIVFAKREKIIIEDYIETLKQLADIYSDKQLSQFIRDITSSELYIQAFQSTVELAEKRHVSKEKILKSKEDIDQYFMGGVIQ